MMRVDAMAALMVVPAMQSLITPENAAETELLSNGGMQLSAVSISRISKSAASKAIRYSPNFDR